MKETWLPVPGYEGLYEASDDGHVRSLDRVVPSAGPYGPCMKRIKGVLLKGRLCDGYPTVILSKENVAKNYSVHVLVMLAFVGNKQAGTEVRHIDGNRTNGKLSNLAYGTKRENHADRDRHGTTARGVKIGISRLSEAAVIEIRSATWGHGVWRHFAEKFGVGKSTVFRARNGFCWKHVASTPSM